MNTKKTQPTPIRTANKWRTRIWASLAFTALLTVASPVSVVHSPALDSSAYAEPIDYRAYAKSAISAYGWNQSQFECLDAIWTKESHWNPLADNPNSTAFGIAQMLGEDSRNGYEQINNGLRYIQHRYETPCNAWRFWQRNYWY